MKGLVLKVEYDKKVLV